MPDEKFTVVPNELLYCDLDPTLKLVWIQLASLCRRGESIDFAKKVTGMAETLGVSAQGLRKSVNKMHRLGAIRKEDGNMILVVPTAEALEEGESQSISAEVEEQPKRKPSGLSQNEAWELVKEAWNREKPESFFRLDGKSSLPHFIALETQAKRLGVERPQYGEFVTCVLRGACADEWWSTREMKLSSIFGFGNKTTDTKFENVEKLYKLGKKAPDTKFSLNDDTAVLRWYNQVDPERGWTHVERVELEDGEDYWAHAKETNDGNVIYLYNEPGSERVYAWTGKLYTRKFRYTPN